MDDPLERTGKNSLTLAVLEFDSLHASCEEVSANQGSTVSCPQRCNPLSRRELRTSGGTVLVSPMCIF